MTNIIEKNNLIQYDDMDYIYYTVPHAHENSMVTYPKDNCKQTQVGQ